MNNNLKPGSLLFRSKGIVEHVGVYLGGDRVIHSSPETGVKVVLIKEFCKGKAIKVQNVEDLDVETLSARIETIFAGSTEYCLTSRNCQHIANYLIHGTPVSPQLRWALLGGVLGSLFATYRGSNSMLYLAGGALLGCLVYSGSLKYDLLLNENEIGSAIL
ncbi:lecithin retinol acyltransferase family protein [Shewanella schlegeliana]|uniref:C40 family peptidase n=1 Tax=Shewanella schlegeliana TaxID=190308 RepID=A0ABS1ST91_9GAMM|nr:lecithin retinol acyltransferase family protein [Shewanella schlegeliana]MBL4911545.1 C40 family peptidase [Shewanella schlegeliana]MCL1111770.1 lecithin retinol acyltransferase family protein [Shewanella schlegeliana]GIU35991.1 hypothetical protein TUM4433_34110 [Shewanella schlegeliana]